MEFLCVFILLIHGATLLVDEFYYHIKRGLPRWERIGHPLDTAVFAGVILFALLSPFNERNFIIYVALSIFSSLFVTKDEFVHAKECDGGEHWLHGILFVFHSLVLGVMGYAWSQMSLNQNQFYTLMINGQAVLSTIFCLYQIIYWNFIYNPQKRGHHVEDKQRGVPHPR